MTELRLPDHVILPRDVAEKLVLTLEDHVQDFSCEHSIDLCFCEERTLIRALKHALEVQTYNLKQYGL